MEILAVVGTATVICAYLGLSRWLYHREVMAGKRIVSRSDEYSGSEDC